MRGRLRMRVLGNRYELLGPPLGRGGMGEVHRARDRALNRLVAIKTLPAELDDDPAFRARFEREAHAAAALSHTNIAVLYDVGTDERDQTVIPYMVMELVAGENLADLVEEGGPLPPAEAALIILEVLEALEHSHARGVVHRDIKPSNIMVDRSGRRPRVKVLDFGIAKLLSDTLTRLTPSGTIVGTLSYVSPEQATGRPLDARSDLYSLGCTLYELLTGTPPFVADHHAAVVRGHLEAAPDPPSARRPGLDPRWDPIVLRALEKDPADRYATATAMYAAVREPTAPEGRTRPDRAAPAPARPVPAAPTLVAESPTPPTRPRDGVDARWREYERHAARTRLRTLAGLTGGWLCLVAVAPLIGLFHSGHGPFGPLWLLLIGPLLVAADRLRSAVPEDPGPALHGAGYLLAAAAVSAPAGMILGVTWWNLPGTAALAAAGVTATELGRRPAASPVRAAGRVAAIAGAAAIAALVTGAAVLLP